MRTIDIDTYSVIELWPGRRLLCMNGDDPALLISLPRSAMAVITGRERAQLTFGSATKTSVVVSGPKQRIASLATMIVTAEQPDARAALT